MDARSFDTLTRRGSLLTLGGAALATALAAPGVVDAKKKRKKKKAGKVCKKKERKRCNADIAACTATIAAQCALGPDPAECVAKFAPCCETCSANGLLTCNLASPS